MTSEEIKQRNRKASDLAWLAQEALVRIAGGRASDDLKPKLAGVAKEALIRLRDLTKDDYRLVIEDLDRLIGRHQARGSAWSEAIDQMESVLQWTQNAPMAPRVRRAV